MIQDPEGAYSQLVRLQEGSGRSTKEYTERSETNLDIDAERLSSSSLLPVVPVDLNQNGDEYHESKSIRNQKKASLKRLASLNKAEIPILLLGSVAAMVHGAVFPIFGYLLSNSINMFFEPPDKLKRDARFWTFVYIILGLSNLVVIPVQNYFFGVAGGKLIKRIRVMSFDKVLHQEISWFDNTANTRYASNCHNSETFVLFSFVFHIKFLSSGAIGARLSTDASALRSLVGDALALIVQNIATLMAGLIIAFATNWMLALIVLSVSPVMFIQGYIQTKFLTGFSADAKVSVQHLD